MKGKYLGNRPMINWIRKVKNKGSIASNIWIGLIASFPSMGNWLAWKIGNGNQVKLDEDPFIG